jgi:hypothetical protein
MAGIISCVLLHREALAALQYSRQSGEPRHASGAALFGLCRSALGIDVSKLRTRRIANDKCVLKLKAVPRARKAGKIDHWKLARMLERMNARAATCHFQVRKPEFLACQTPSEAHMSRKQYFVSCEDSEWIIKLEDERIGGYPSEAGAFRAAQLIWRATEEATLKSWCWPKTIFFSIKVDVWTRSLSTLTGSIQVSQVLRFRSCLAVLAARFVAFRVLRCLATIRLRLLSDIMGMATILRWRAV